jgi:outer membrane protein assembly factor BamB
LWNFDALTGKLNASRTGVPMDSTPALANGVLYIGSDEQTNTISAYNAANGKLLWRAPTAGWAQSPPTVANGMLYVGSHNQFTAYGLP